MACTLPMQAYKTPGGGVQIGRPPPLTKMMLLPCGKCIGCITSNARAWALRCHLELQDHTKGAFTTLTYDAKYVPPTLRKRDLQLWLKRLREKMGANRPIRFFASGEYGEQNGRPHYHALIYGADENDGNAINQCWRQGLTHTVKITPANINYTAGYTAKKFVLRDETRRERISDDGEIYKWQPPFIQMSRNPGIGGKAREHTDSWRSYAINNGTKMPVPRFLHEAWKKQATEEEIEALALEKEELQQLRKTTLQMLEAQEKINNSRQALKAAKRKL